MQTLTRGMSVINGTSVLLRVFAIIMLCYFLVSCGGNFPTSGTSTSSGRETPAKPLTILEKLRQQRGIRKYLQGTLGINEPARSFNPIGTKRRGITDDDVKQYIMPYIGAKNTGRKDEVDAGFTEINLSCSNITNKAMDYLQDLRLLRYLNVYKTKVTEKRIDNFAKHRDAKLLSKVTIISRAEQLSSKFTCP